MEGAEASDRNVEMWKIKKLIKSLEAARGYIYKFIINYTDAKPLIRLVSGGCGVLFIVTRLLADKNKTSHCLLPTTSSKLL